MANHSGVLASLKQFVDPVFLGQIEQFEMKAPDTNTLWLGVLENSMLYLYEQGTSNFKYAATLDKINATIKGKAEHGDVGDLMPNGTYVLASAPFAGSTIFPLLYISGPKPVARFLLAPGEIQFGALIPSKDATTEMKKRGMIMYNATVSPKPLLGFLAYEPTRRNTFYWQFIDALVGEALTQLSRSKTQLEAMEVEVKKRPLPATVTEMFKQLRAKANLYLALEVLQSQLKILSYLRYLRFLPGFTVARLFGGDLMLESRFTKLVDEMLPALEQKMQDDGKRLTIDDLLKRVDQHLAELRKKVPLLGRLSWAEIKWLDDDGLAGRVLSLLAYLKEQNARAQEMTEADTTKIRKLLTVIPPRVMGIPRLVQKVEQQQMSAINADIDYFFAVKHLKDQAESFPLMLGLAQLVFTFFCPPVGVALGFFQAAISIDSAMYKTALSDADYDIDKTMVSQAEAAEARFWAAVDVIFACVDLAEFSALVRESKDVAKLAKADELARLSDEVKTAAAGADSSRVADEIASAPDDIKQLEAASPPPAAADDLKKAETPPSSPAPDAAKKQEPTPSQPLDVKAAREDAAVAKKGTVDTNPENPTHLENPPATADEAIEQARKSDPEVWQSLEGRGRPEGMKSKVPAEERIRKDYKQHFDDVQKKAAEARAKGLPEPKPEHPNHFARRRYEEMLDRSTVRNVKPPPRAGFFDDVAKGQKKTLGELLTDADALREAFVKRLKGKAKVGALGKADDDFIAKLRAAILRKEPDAVLNKIIADEFLKPLDDIAAKAGHAAGDGRDFALFARGIDNITDWTDADAFKALNRLFTDVGVDNGTLFAALNKAHHSERIGKSTKILNEELAKALDKIRNVPGVLTRSTLSNKSLLYALATAHNRGVAFEVRLLGDLMEPAAAAGAKISSGKRWWLESLEEFYKAGKLKNRKNVLEADILVEFPDGRRVLIDAKFYEDGVVINEVLVDQLTKHAAAIDEGIVHNTEYWVSNRFMGALEKEELIAAGKLKEAKELFTNLDAFQTHADLLSGGKIHLQYNVMEEGFPKNFFDTSRFSQVSRGDGVTILVDDALGIPATGPKVTPAAATPAPSVPAATATPAPATPPAAPTPTPTPSPTPAPTVPAPVATPAPVSAVPAPAELVPAPERVQTLVPRLRQPELVLRESKAAEHYAKSTIRVSPLLSEARMVVRTARVDDGIKTPIRAFQLLRVKPASTFGRMLQARYEPRVVDASAVLQSVQDFNQGTTCVLQAAPPLDKDKFYCLERTQSLSDRTGDFYAVYLVREERGPATVKVEAVLHDRDGRVLWINPAQPIAVPQLSGALIPFSIVNSASPHFYQFEPGFYSWGLRIIAGDGGIRLYPATLPMRIQEY